MQKQNLRTRQKNLITERFFSWPTPGIKYETKIGPTVQKHFHSTLFEKIPNRKSPGTTYCIYTEYASDLNGDYTYFIGEEVNSLNDLPEGFKGLTIPVQQYIKFTNGPGAMPEVCIHAWKKIWQMSPEELGGKRNYIADFEVYDERAQDPKNVTLDVFIGVN